MIGRSSDRSERIPVPPARSAARGALIGFVTVGFFVAIMASWSGYTIGEATLMGLFVASWGGVGFGAMVAGTVAVLRSEDRERLAAAAAEHAPHGAETQPAERKSKAA